MKGTSKSKNGNNLFYFKKGCVFVESLQPVFIEHPKREAIHDAWFKFFRFITFWLTMGFKFVQVCPTSSHHVLLTSRHVLLTSRPRDVIMSKSKHLFQK